MSYYPDVKPGDDWKPEPAPRYNAVNRMLGDLGYSGAGRGAPGIENFNIVSAVNRHTAAISAGMAVEAVSAPADADVPVIPVKPSAGASGAFYGVALDTLEPGDVGRMLLTGVTTVQLSSAPAAGTQYVEPDSANPGKFKAATGGRARVLATDAGTQPDGGTPRPTATVILGGGGSSGNPGYTGYFKVVNASEYDEEGKLTAAKVRIVNGSEPLASRDHAAGSISAYGNTYPIAAKTIALDGNAGGKTYVYLRFIDATAEEPAEFVSSSSRLQDNGLNNLLLIAEISAGVETISQLVQTTQPPVMGNTYTGAFSMVQIGRDKALIQGSNTDLGYCEAVELSTTSGPTYYMLCGWLEGEEYKVELRSSPPDAVYYGRFNIAYVKDGKFFQQWTRGAIEFKDYYYL